MSFTNVNKEIGCMPIYNFRMLLFMFWEVAHIWNMLLSSQLNVVMKDLIHALVPWDSCHPADVKYLHRYSSKGPRCCWSGTWIHISVKRKLYHQNFMLHIVHWTIKKEKKMSKKFKLKEEGFLYLVIVSN